MAKPQLKELTQAQKDLLPTYLKRFQEIGLSTTPTDKAKAEAAGRKAYDYLVDQGVKEYTKNPEIIWADSPWAGAKLAAQHAKGDVNVTPEEVRAQAGLASYGSFEAYWVSVYTFINEQLLPPDQKDQLALIALEIVENCGVFWTFENLIIMTPKPSEIHLKDGKFHNPEGMALRYANGDGIYALNGERKKSLMDVVLAAKNGGTTDAA